MNCIGCGIALTGKQKHWHSDACKNAFNTEARRKAALARAGNGKGKIHAAPVIGNPRLEPLMLAIQTHKVRTSLELHELTGSMAIHSDIAEIRERGYPIGPAKYVGKSATGRKIFEYRWLD